MKYVIVMFFFPLILNAGLNLTKMKTRLKETNQSYKKNENPEELKKENIKQLEREILGKIGEGQYIKNPEIKKEPESN